MLFVCPGLDLRFLLYLSLGAQPAPLPRGLSFFPLLGPRSETHDKAQGPGLLLCSHFHFSMFCELCFFVLLAPVAASVPGVLKDGENSLQPATQSGVTDSPLAAGLPTGWAGT